MLERRIAALEKKARKNDSFIYCVEHDGRGYFAPLSFVTRWNMGMLYREIVCTSPVQREALRDVTSAEIMMKGQGFQ